MKQCLIVNMLLAAMMLMACTKIPSPVIESGQRHRTFYVSPDGSDSHDGTLASPFKSISLALSKVLAGDTVVARGGIYYEQFSFPRSGTSDAWVTLKAYPGEKPVIDGTGITIQGWQALVTLSNVRYIAIDGFDIRNLTTASSSSDPEGISVTGNSHHIAIRHCNIYNITSTSPLAQGRSAHAIFVLGNGNSAITDIEITDNTVHDTKTGTSENITLAGNVDGFTISRNKVYQTENIGIIIAGGDNLHPQGNIATNYARNGVVSDNELYGVSFVNSVDQWGAGNYGAIAIYVCGGANVIIERNKVYNSDRGIGLVSESNLLATKNCIVRNNFVYNCWRTGIYMGDYLNYTEGGTYDCQVVNNTLFRNNRVKGAFDEVEGEIRLTERCFNNVVRNNIVYARPEGVFVHKYTNTGANNVIDNNHYYSTATPKWIWNSINGAPITDFNTWKATSGVDANSVFGTDPLLVDLTLPDLHIRPASPAKNSGFVLSAAIVGQTDIDGQPRIKDNKISKGAQQ